MTDTETIAARWDAYYAGSVTRVPYTDAVVFALRALAADPRATVYEFGCGTGQNLGFLKSLFPEAVLVGSDASAAGLALARRLHPGLLLFCNGDRLGLAAEGLDAAFGRAALQHVPKPLGRAYIGEIAAALKPGAPAFFEIASTGHGLYASVGDGGEDPVFGYRVFYALDEALALFEPHFEVEHVYERARARVAGPAPAGGRPPYDERAFQIHLRRRQAAL